MAFSDNTAQRIREILQQKEVAFFEKKMFGGICFMVDEKICCATKTDKDTCTDLLLCRISETDYTAALKRDDMITMGKSENKMKGFIYVTEDGFRSHKALVNWIQACIAFNPFAKASKKKKHCPKIVCNRNSPLTTGFCHELHEFARINL